MPPDIGEIIVSASPMVTITMYATGSLTITTVTSAVRLVMGVSCAMAAFSSTSRLTWAWARDGGLPQYFGYVDESNRVPARGVVLKCRCCLLLPFPASLAMIYLAFKSILHYTDFIIQSGSHWATRHAQYWQRIVRSVGRHHLALRNRVLRQLHHHAFCHALRQIHQGRPRSRRMEPGSLRNRHQRLCPGVFLLVCHLPWVSVTSARHALEHELVASSVRHNHDLDHNAVDFSLAQDVAGTKREDHGFCLAVLYLRRGRWLRACTETSCQLGPSVPSPLAKYLREGQANMLWNSIGTVDRKKAMAVDSASRLAHSLRGPGPS